MGSLVAGPPAPDVRLGADRTFTIRGAGTVVTGTLVGGTVGAAEAAHVDLIHHIDQKHTR